MPRWQLSKRLSERDWWGVVIDLLILVVGVFLGIQAANWNEDRKDRASSRSYLTRIREDLASEIKNLDQHERYWEVTAEAGERALAFAEGRAEYNDWSLLNDFYAAGQRWRFTPNDATYSELLSAGRLDLIGEIPLRNRLGEYYVGQRDETVFLADVDSGYRLQIRAIVPHQVQRYLIERCQPRNGILLRLDDCPQPAVSMNVESLNRKFANDEKLIGELRTWMTTLYYMRSVGRDRRSQAASLIAAIDKSLR